MKHTHIERISHKKREIKMTEENQPKRLHWQKQVSFQNLKPTTKLMIVCLASNRDEVLEHKFFSSPNMAPLYWPQMFKRWGL